MVSLPSCSAAATMSFAVEGRSPSSAAEISGAAATQTIRATNRTRNEGVIGSSRAGNRGMISPLSFNWLSWSDSVRLLIAEDHAALAASVAKAFRAKGYAVDCVGTVDDASAALRTQP